MFETGAEWVLGWGLILDIPGVILERMIWNSGYFDTSILSKFSWL